MWVLASPVLAKPVSQSEKDFSLASPPVSQSRQVLTFTRSLYRRARLSSMTPRGQGLLALPGVPRCLFKSESVGVIQGPPGASPVVRLKGEIRQVALPPGFKHRIQCFGALQSRNELAERSKAPHFTVFWALQSTNELAECSIFGSTDPCGGMGTAGGSWS